MKTLPKRIETKTTGVFYKEIISKNNKVTDYLTSSVEQLDGSAYLFTKDSNQP